MNVDRLLPIGAPSNPPQSMWRRARRRIESKSDRGATAAELVVIAPVLIVLFMFVLYMGRLGQTATRVHHAADQGARAASLVSSGRMAGAAGAAALADLRRNGQSCVSPQVSAAVHGASGSVRSVTVTVRCTVNRRSISALMPGRQTVTASSTEVIDFHRAGEGRP